MLFNLVPIIIFKPLILALVEKCVGVKAS